MKRLPFLLPLIGALVLFTACGGTSNSQTSTGDVKLTTQVDSASYALGVSVATQVKGQGFEDMNFDALIKGMKDVYAAEGLEISEVEAQGVLQTFFMTAMERQKEKNREEGIAFLEKNKGKKGVNVTDSGLQYEVVKNANGAKPVAEDQVKVHYHGTLLDGTVFDSSVERGQPATFGLNQVIPGWTEGLQLMPVGSKFKFYIPSDLAYGENPRPGGPIGPNMVLVFEVELIEIVK